MYDAKAFLCSSLAITLGRKCDCAQADCGGRPEGGARDKWKWWEGATLAGKRDEVRVRGDR